MLPEVRPCGGQLHSGMEPHALEGSFAKDKDSQSISYGVYKHPLVSI